MKLRHNNNPSSWKFELIKAKDYEDMSRLAAEKVISLVKDKPNALLGLATGQTPEGMYQMLAEDHIQNGTDYQDIHTVNLDEYVGLDKEDPNSYFTYMCKHFFHKVNLSLENTHLPNGLASDMDAETARYEQQIKELGGVDLQILGIGRNGHIGFNEPGTTFKSRTHVIELAEDTIQANSRYFDSLEDVPKQAVTMGIQSILESKEIILLASGASKADALKQFIFGEITEDFPASALRLHPKVTIIADQDALRNLEA